MKENKNQAALDYHSSGRPGKIEVISSKPCITARDLALAYSPGVAEPCLEIAKDPDLVYKYTAKGNLVGVVSNGRPKMKYVFGKAIIHYEKLIPIKLKESIPIYWLYLILYP